MFFFFSSRRRHTRFDCDWSSDVCSSDLAKPERVQKLAIIHDRPNGSICDAHLSLELSLSAPSVLLETDRFPLQNATERSFVYREWNDEIIDIVVLERQIRLFANCEDRTICANARPQTALEFLRYQFEPRIESEGIGSRSLSRTVFRPPRYKAHG